MKTKITVATVLITLSTSLANSFDEEDRSPLPNQPPLPSYSEHSDGENEPSSPQSVEEIEPSRPSLSSGFPFPNLLRDLPSSSDYR
ncbi:MAG: hypothetical protein KBC28_10540 [Alphaproteobacteria bacterium]|jgi:hypothetical protein|nr:hypothetical protein [Alphaproteobacteria bacterium]